jgi:hypothetical protein
MPEELQQQHEEQQRQQEEEEEEESSDVGTALADQEVGCCKVEDPWSSWTFLFLSLYQEVGGWSLPNIICACLLVLSSMMDVSLELRGVLDSGS